MINLDKNLVLYFFMFFFNSYVFAAVIESTEKATDVTVRISENMHSIPDLRNDRIHLVRGENHVQRDEIPSPRSLICKCCRTLGSYIWGGIEWLLIDDPRLPPAYMHEAYREY